MTFGEKSLSLRFKRKLQDYFSDDRGWDSLTLDLIEIVKEYNKEVVGEDDETRIASDEQMIKVRAENNLKTEIRQRQEELL